MLNPTEKTKWCSAISKVFKSGVGTKGKHKATNHRRTLEIILPLIEEPEFDYNNEPKSHLNACKLFLDLWEYLFDLAPYIPYHERKLCYDIILCIMKRKEFDPATLELQQKSLSTFMKRLSAVGTPTAKEISLMYKTLALKTHQYVLTQLQTLTSYAELPSFFPSVLAINSFRLGDYAMVYDIINSMCTPRPSEKTLDIVQKNTTLFLGDAQDSPIDQNSQNSQNKRQEVFNRLFRYQMYFSSLKVKLEEDVLSMSKSVPTFLPKIAALKPEFFLVFLAEFVSQVTELLFSSTSRIEWEYVPRYIHLLSSYIEMHIETPSLSQYTNEWLTASLVLLQNNEVINCLMECSLHKTRIYDVEAVLELLNVMDPWFIQLKELHAELPHNFDYEKFNSIVDALFQTEHFQIVSRTLIFLYNILDIFSGNHRIHLISEILLKKYFFSLFLHWNGDVRMCYQRILVYKVVRYRRKKPMTLSRAYTPRTSQEISRPSIDRSMRDNMRGHSLDIERSRVSRDYVPSQRIRPKSQASSILDPKNIHSNYMYKLVSFSPQRSMGLIYTFVKGDTDGEQNPEEAVDMVLHSKVETYIAALKRIIHHNTNEADSHNNHTDDHEKKCPVELEIYVHQAMFEYNELQKEYRTWKKAMDVTSAEIQYPILQFPKFTFSEND